MDRPRTTRFDTVRRDVTSSTRLSLAWHEDDTACAGNPNAGSNRHGIGRTDRSEPGRQSLEDGHRPVEFIDERRDLSVVRRVQQRFGDLENYDEEVQQKSGSEPKTRPS